VPHPPHDSETVGDPSIISSGSVNVLNDAFVDEEMKDVQLPVYDLEAHNMGFVVVENNVNFGLLVR
jgi:hypothetical protein